MLFSLQLLFLVIQFTSVLIILYPQKAALYKNYTNILIKHKQEGTEIACGCQPPLYVIGFHQRAPPTLLDIQGSLLPWH